MPGARGRFERRGYRTDIRRRLFDRWRRKTEACASAFICCWMKYSDFIATSGSGWISRRAMTPAFQRKTSHLSDGRVSNPHALAASADNLTRRRVADALTSSSCLAACKNRRLLCEIGGRPASVASVCYHSPRKPLREARIAIRRRRVTVCLGSQDKNGHFQIQRLPPPPSTPTPQGALALVHRCKYLRAVWRATIWTCPGLHPYRRLTSGTPDPPQTVDYFAQAPGEVLSSESFDP